RVAARGEEGDVLGGGIRPVGVGFRQAGPPDSACLVDQVVGAPGLQALDGRPALRVVDRVADVRVRAVVDGDRILLQAVVVDGGGAEGVGGGAGRVGGQRLRGGRRGGEQGPDGAGRGGGERVGQLDLRGLVGDEDDVVDLAVGQVADGGAAQV